MTPTRTAPRLLSLGLLTVLLAACGATVTVTPEPNPTPNPTPTPTPSEVAGLIPGKITPFKAGDASSVHEGNGTPANQTGGGSLVDANGNLLTALVSTQGVFDMALPKVATMTAAPDASLLFTVANFFACDGGVATVPSGMLIYPILSLNTDAGKNIVSEIDPNKANFNYRTWWFSNMDATLKYKGDCTLGLGKIDTSFNLKKGWNLVILETNPGVSSTLTASTQPTSAVPWRYTASSMGAAALKAYPNLLTPWRALPQYRDR